LKVLVVDDEPLMRKGIVSKIDWQALGLECAGEATDSFDALEQIRRLKPDILITDIRMPEMDGLELIERAQQLEPSLQFIIVSGYDDFQYARRAIRFGVSDYLLKPVKPEELRDSLRRLGSRRAPQEGDGGLRRQFLKHYEAYRTSRRHRQWSRLIQGSMAADEAEAHLAGEQCGSDAGWEVVVFRLQPVVFPHLGFRADEEELLWFGIQNIAEQAMAESGRKGAAFKHAFCPDELVAVAPCPPSPCRSNADLWASRVLEAVRRYMRLEASAGVSRRADAPSGLKKAYEQAAFAARGEVLHGTGRVYRYEEGTFCSPDGGIYPQISGEQERLLLLHLRDRNEPQIVAWMERQYRELAANPRAGYLHFERLSLQIYALLLKGFQPAEERAETAFREEGDFLAGLLSFRTWREAADALLDMAGSLCRLNGEPRSLTGGDIVGQVKQYIEQFYYEEINLSWVASKYFIHPNYFSKLFKEKCGVNFSDYVTKVRLSKAIELMSSQPARTIAEIAMLVGYDSPAYFNNVFRKAFGITPKKYQEKKLLS
jgi:two-component system response regulator YesN